MKLIIELLLSIALLLLLFVLPIEHYSYPLSAIEMYNQGVLFQGQGKIDEAIAKYYEAISLYEHFPQAHQNLGILMEGLSELDRAVFHHEQSVMFASDDSFKSSSIVNLVLVCLKARKVKSRDYLLSLISYLGN